MCTHVPERDGAASGTPVAFGLRGAGFFAH